MKNKLKEQKGFAAADALIAVLLIVLFSALIATISYNIYLSNSSIKRMSKATGYILEVFEYIDELNYDEVIKEDIIKEFNENHYYSEDGSTPIARADVKMKENDENVETPFKAEINILKYKDVEGSLDTEKLDLVQEITMTVKYKLGNKDQEITMTRNKTR